jgi:hypothetical protein
MVVLLKLVLKLCFIHNSDCQLGYLYLLLNNLSSCTVTVSSNINILGSLTTCKVCLQYLIYHRQEKDEQYAIEV